MVEAVALAAHLDNVLQEATIPELPNHYRGKVRDNYDLADGRRIIIATDRLSAFDRVITAIPLKGQVLTQIAGVGALTAVAFAVTIGDRNRFARSRTVGAWLGLTPGQRASGNQDPQQRITKEGDHYLRRLLVNCAHYILGPFGPDCDLRRHGAAIAARGGTNAKKRAVVAVARKLAVLMHRLWCTQAVYEPLRKAADSIAA